VLKATKHTLPGGLRVILAPMPDSPTVTVKVSVETGSKYESKKEAGLSHFLEHMCFKGTKKRPSAQHVARDLDEIGAVYNAYTDTEITSYYAKASSKNVSKLIDIVSDIYLNTVFRDEDAKKEKGVITEEINMREDQPEIIAAELFNHAVHGDQPAGRSIIGSKKSVSSFTKKDFNNYHRKHYVASATVLTVAGSFNSQKILKQIRDAFKNVSHGGKHGKERTRISHRNKQVVVRGKKTDQVHLVLGVRSFPYSDKRNTALAVLRGVLSHGMSSRLWIKMREELGICYYISSHNSPSTDHGEFMVVSGVDPKRIGVATDAICKELKRLKEESVGGKELKRVKGAMTSVLNMSLESSDEVAAYFAGRAIFHHDLKTPKQIEKEIRKVSARNIRTIARKIFTDKDLTLAVVGKNLKKNQLVKILSLA